MKRIIILAAVTLAVAACAGGQKTADEAKMMARYVPERADDFVFENNLIAGRIYGKALEGNPTSPGIDVWVKMPGALVADDWYAHAVEDPEYYHHDHGGKDCYKVAVSLGGGASVPFVGGVFCYPETNWRDYEILIEDSECIKFGLSYPEWDANGVKVSLQKIVTVYPDTHFCRVEDYYFGDFESLTVAAGVWRHDGPEQEISLDDRFAIWEAASDQSIEAEDGMLGLAVYMPEAQECCIAADAAGREHSLCLATIASGEPLVYYFGSCWSKGDITSAEEWFATVKALSDISESGASAE